MIEPKLPPDFDVFWSETVAEATGAPLDFSLDPGTGDHGPGTSSGSHQISTFSFRGIKGNRLHGWIAVPLNGEEKSPAFLWVPPYGRESLLPNAYGTREGFVSLSFNFFGHPAFHEEKYRTERGYFSEGANDPHTWVFREMFQNAVLAARVLAEQPEVLPDRVAVAGMSQGAGISIWLGAWLPLIKVVCADMPFLGGMSQVLGHRVYRYPLKELIDFAGADGLDRVKQTISYFDTLNQATRCQKPTHLTLGEKDPAVRPESVEAIFEALSGRKILRRYPVGHDWYPDMIENNRQWMLENL
jgi:cephalosporin-C deacetylase